MVETYVEMFNSVKDIIIRSTGAIVVECRVTDGQCTDLFDERTFMPIPFQILPLLNCPLSFHNDLIIGQRELHIVLIDRGGFAETCWHARS